MGAVVHHQIVADSQGISEYCTDIGQAPDASSNFDGLQGALLANTQLEFCLLPPTAEHSVATAWRNVYLHAFGLYGSNTPHTVQADREQHHTRIPTGNTPSPNLLLKAMPGPTILH